MNIGLLKEIKAEEYRVGLTPTSAREYIDHGHTVYVESNAGLGSGFSDEPQVRQLIRQVKCMVPAPSAETTYARSERRAFRRCRHLKL